MRLIVLLCCLLAQPALAERQISPDEFAEMVTSRTMYFDRYGQPFGAEQYFDDNRVIWAFEGGTCQRGIWFSNSEGDICFVYDNNPVSQCWTFLEVPSGGFHARLSGADPADDLVMQGLDEEPLDCPLDDLGV
ncbi:hypothetical protein [Jannaschia pohangensis]|uniref:Uncharacterized protein n=1 Tax=Jannaschia pohangensis TaxID=390807 RepID=A0A1I3UBM4_9RHOB|nr:hypothetical protein [Jannaschia pohangensis]SFJ80312.1 hypothetical protein SAMN04488095_3704 [Jannaschia pohangensis]